ncbi:MAG: cell division protein FtsZ [Verrucomicrobiota bacterium]
MNASREMNPGPNPGAPTAPEVAGSPGSDATPMPMQEFRVVAVGRAGIHAVERLCGAGALPGVDVIACHTSASALAQSAAPFKVPLKSAGSRGLGAGGDPLLGQASAEGSKEALGLMLAGARVVFVLTGLGAGTGTGAAHVVARCARDAGALVLGVATMPFDCEGRLRGGHARRGLELLKGAADAVVTVRNQHVLETLDERAPAAEVFDAANRLLVEGVCGLWGLLTRPGLIRLDFASLERLLRGRHTESVFATAEGSGERRASEAAERLLAHPFVARDAVLGTADAVVLSAVTGPDVPFTDIERAFSLVQRHCDQAQVVVGTSIDPGMTGRLSITLVASIGGSAPLPEASGAEASAVGAPKESPTRDVGIGMELSEPTSSMGRASGSLVPPAPVLTVDQRQKALDRSGKGSSRRRRVVQSMFDFDVVSRGRFEKTEATILDGQDYDVPTFLRRRISLN